MFERVLVAVADRDSGRDVVALAESLRAPEAQVTLVNLYLNDEYVWAGARPAYHAEQRAGGIMLLRSLAPMVSPAPDLRCGGAPAVAKGLHDLAGELDADLIVVGTSRRGRWGHLFLGDDTKAILKRPPCAIAVAPSGYAVSRSAAIQHIGVADNQTPQSQHALDAALRLGTELQARVSTWEAPAGPGHDPVWMLTTFSGSVDLLVIGARDFGPFGRLLHPSTIQVLARTTACPLLVLPRAARNADSGAAPGRAPRRRRVGRDHSALTSR